LDNLKRSIRSIDFAAQYQQEPIDQQEPIAAGGNLVKWKADISERGLFFSKPYRDSRPRDNEVQRVGKDGFEAVISSFGEANKGFQAIAAEITAYSKKSFEDGTRAFEQLLGAKSFEQVIEIQSQYARMAYKTYGCALMRGP
jgi:hypothetical protein